MIAIFKFLEIKNLFRLTITDIGNHDILYQEEIDIEKTYYIQFLVPPENKKEAYFTIQKKVKEALLKFQKDYEEHNYIGDEYELVN
jgi:hypothetical protein